MGDEAGALEGKSLSNLRVVDLKMELEKRGLSKSGSKKDLVKRLKQKLELEKLYEESSAIGERKSKLQLDEATERNEFVQQYLAEQREIYARQTEVRRLIELGEREESGGSDDSDVGMKDQDSDVSEGLSLSKSTCDSSAIVEGEDEDHHDEEQTSVPPKSEFEEVSATPVEPVSCSQENPCDSTNSPNQPTDGKSEQSDIPTEMESKSRDTIAFSLLDISLPESPKVLSGRSGSKSPRSAVDKLPQKTNSFPADSIAAELENLKTNGSVKKMSRSGKRRWSDSRKTPTEEASDSTKYVEQETKLATEEAALKGQLDSKHLNVDDSVVKADAKVDSSNKLGAETIPEDSKTLSSKPGEDADTATCSNRKNTDQETSSVSLFPEQVSEVSESNESKGKQSIKAVDKEKNQVDISEKEKKMDTEIVGMSKTSNQSLKKVEKLEKIVSRSRKTKRQDSSSSSSSSSASSRSSSPEMRTSRRRRKVSKSPKTRHEKDSDVKQRHRDARQGRDSKHRKGFEKTRSTSPDMKRRRSPNVRQRMEADSKQRKSGRASRSISPDEKRSKSPDVKQKKREADSKQRKSGRASRSISPDEKRSKSPDVKQKKREADSKQRKSGRASRSISPDEKRSKSPDVKQKKREADSKQRKSGRASRSISPDEKRSKSPDVKQKKREADSKQRKSGRASRSISPDEKRSKSPDVKQKKREADSEKVDEGRGRSPVVMRKKSSHASSRNPVVSRSKSPVVSRRSRSPPVNRSTRSLVVLRKKSPYKSSRSPDARQSKSPDENQRREADLKQRRSPVASRSKSPDTKQGIPEVSQSRDSVTDKTTEEKKTRSAKHKSISPKHTQSSSPLKRRSHSQSPRQNSRSKESVSLRKRQSVSPTKRQSVSPQQKQSPSSEKGRNSSPEETQGPVLGISDKKRNMESEKSLDQNDSSDSSSDSDRRESQRATPLKAAVLPKKRLSRIEENKVLSEKKIEREPRQPKRPKLNRSSFSMPEDVVMKDVEEKNKEIACLKLNESVVSLQEKVSKIEDMVMEEEKRLSLEAAAAAPEIPPEKISYRKLNTPFKKHEDKDKNLGRKRRWRSSSNMLQNTVMVISSDSLKNLIPEFKLTPVPSKEMDAKSKETENSTVNEATASKVDEANKDYVGDERATTPKVTKADGVNVLKLVKASSSKVTLKEKKKLAEDSLISQHSCSAFSSALRLFKSTKSLAKPSLPAKKDEESIKKEELAKKDIDMAKAPALPVDRPEPPPSKPPSCIIFIQNLVRPFTLMQLRNLLNQTGTVVEEGFWIDKIKSKCFVKYETEEEAVKTREALHETRWPPSNPKILSVDFSNQDEFDRCSRGYDVPMPPVPIAATAITQPDIRKRDESHDLTDLRKKRLERHSKEREHSRQNVTYVREWDKDKLTQDSPERDRSRPIKERNRSSERRRDSKRGDSKKKPLEDTPAKLLDDLFQKTKNTPCIYWLPLTEEQVKAQEEARRQRRLDREKRNQLAREQEAERRAKRKPREKDTRSRSRSRQGRRR